MTSKPFSPSDTRAAFIVRTERYRSEFQFTALLDGRVIAQEVPTFEIAYGALRGAGFRGDPYFYVSHYRSYYAAINYDEVLHIKLRRAAP